MPIYQLMPAASSCHVPVATPLLGGLPGKIERPHLFGDPHVGHPSIIMSPDDCPWTQIRLGAGTRNMHICRNSREAADDLNHNVFASILAAQLCGGSSSASRSFVLACAAGAPP
jgi:hypothetical protein